MSQAVIEGIFILGAAIVSGAIAIIGSRSGAQVSKLRERQARVDKKNARLLRQLEAYHLLEDLYAKTLSEQDGRKAPRTIKTEYRNRVVELHDCARPEMTANEAKKQLEDGE